MDEFHADPVFDGQSTPTLLLDTDFTIQAANKAYLSATGRSDDELVALYVFDAFPDNPEDPEADGVANLSRSLERVARTRRPHNVWVQRYDIPVGAEGGFAKKYWRPVNTPIIDDGRLVGFAHQVEDITSLQDGLHDVLEQYRDLPPDGRMTEAQARRFAESASVVAASVAWLDGLTEEVMGLRRALDSRATIDQAKGIIMAERRCSPDMAFGILAKLSQDTNVKVADVAAAFVYQAQKPIGAA